jgi:isopenicillin N synthase-like dioxygenase
MSGSSLAGGPGYADRPEDGMVSAPEIPVIAWTDLLDADPVARARVAEGIEVGFGRYGLVYVSGHPIARHDVLDLYDRFLEILARPESEKAGWGGPQIWYQRGWTPPNTEQAVIAGGQPDFKECYFAAPEPLDPICQRCYPEVYAANVWPRDAAPFREGLLGIGHGLHEIGLQLLAACEQALSVEAGAIIDKTNGGAHVSRLLKYLPLSDAQRTAPQRVLWGEEHTDFNVLTLLPGGCFYRDGTRGERPAEAGGLFLRTRPTEDHPTGQLVPGRPPEGCLVAQVGQQLEVLSGGRYLATPHGIVAPESPGWTRTSLAHFVHLEGRQRVEPLPPFLEESDAYLPPVLAGTYATKTLVDIGLAPPLALQKLGYRHYDRLAAIRRLEGGAG